MASLLTRGDRADRKFYLQWRERPQDNNLTRLLVGVRTLSQAKEIKTQFEAARLSGKQGEHILFELGVGARPADYRELRVIDGHVVELPPPRQRLLMGPLLREWASQLTNANARDDQSKVEKHLWPYYQNVPLAEGEQIKSVLAYLAWLVPRIKASQTRRHCMNLLSRFFGWAILRGHTSINPVKNLPQGARPAPSGKSDAPWLRETLDMSLLRAHLPEALALIFWLGNRSGMRPGETAGLLMEDFDWLHEGIIRVAHSYGGDLKENHKATIKKVKWAPAPDDVDEVLGPWLAARRAQGAGPKDLVFPFASAALGNPSALPASVTIRNKAEFIRSLPDRSSKEVAALAKAAGLEITEAHVYQQRYNDRKAQQAPEAPSAKADFVRKHPDVPARHMVELAAAEGIDLKPDYVKWVRGRDRRVERRDAGKVVGLSTLPLLDLPRQRKTDWEGFTKDYLNKTWRKFQLKAMADQKHITLYQATRHSFTSRNLAGDVPIEEVSDALGHSSVVVTQKHYNHFVRRRYSDKIRQSTKKASPTPAAPKEPHD